MTFIGNATVLVRLGPFTFLTDPNFLHAGEFAYLGAGVRSKRLKDPAVWVDELSMLDFVMLSQHRGDHFDEFSARELDPQTPIVTEPQSAERLVLQGFDRVVPLRTWESTSFEKVGQVLRITSMPGKHSPAFLAKVIPPVMGSMLEFERDGKRPFRIYITGDSLMHDKLHEIPTRYPDIDVCLVHLGGTQVLGVLLTMDDKQGTQSIRMIAPKLAVPIHIDDYTVMNSPLIDLQEAIRTELPNAAIEYLDRGEAFECYF